MKNLLFGIFLSIFMLFGAAGVQNVVADDVKAEYSVIDKDPTKDGKKDKKEKDKKATTSAKEKDCKSVDKKGCHETKDPECAKMNTKKTGCCSKGAPDKK